MINTEINRLLNFAKQQGLINQLDEIIIDDTINERDLFVLNSEHVPMKISRETMALAPIEKKL